MINNIPSIKTTNNRHTLRIVVRFNSKSFFIYPGLKDNHNNRLICQDIERIIRADIEQNRFDYSFESYKYQNKNVLDNRKLTFIEVAEKYMQTKSEYIAIRTKQFNYALFHDFNNFTKNKFITNVTYKDINRYYEYLLDKNNKAETIKRKLKLINNIFIWGINNRLINSNDNPIEYFFIQQIKIVNKNNTKQKNYKIFNDDEIEKIYYWFIENKLIMYADYTYFKFQTGLRPGEINGLTKESFLNDYSVIYINKSWNGINYRPTKTHENRSFKLNNNLIEFITNHINVFCNETNIIFHIDGNQIDTHNYRNIWVKCLKELDIEYTSPYNTRHTFISKKLLEGKNPVTIAKITGHSIETLFRVYARFFDDIPSI